MEDSLNLNIRGGARRTKILQARTSILTDTSRYWMAATDNCFASPVLAIENQVGAAFANLFLTGQLKFSIDIDPLNVQWYTPCFPVNCVGGRAESGSLWATGRWAIVVYRPAEAWRLRTQAIPVCAENPPRA